MNRIIGELKMGCSGGRRTSRRGGIPGDQGAREEVRGEPVAGSDRRMSSVPLDGESSVGWGTKSRMSMAGGGPGAVKRRGRCTDNSSQKHSFNPHHLSRKLSRVLGGMECR